MTERHAADLVLHNGAVYTVADPDSVAEAVAIRAGRLIAIGTDEQVRPFIGTSTETIDLKRRLLLPGFQDAHVHPVDGGITRNRCDLHDLANATDYLAAIGEYARSRPQQPWILGGGWSMDAFPRGLPERAPLDAVVSDRPVYLPNRDGHTGWVNSRALELAEITAHTLDPADGRIERDHDGHPTGALHEGAQRLVTRLIPPVTEGDLTDGLLEGQRYLHSVGITGWQDAIVGGDVAENNTLTAYQGLDREHRLTGRVVGALWWDRNRDSEQIHELIEHRAASSGRRFRASSVKIMLDGVCETRTASMLEPYLDGSGNPTADRGIAFIDPGELRRYVTELDAADFQTHFHAIGDRAVRDALDAIEAARSTNGYTDTRPQIAHIQVIHPDDRPRFARLGVIANMQPLWACNEPQMSELTIPLLGPRRATWQYPFASLMHTGARLAGGSDWPVSTPDPLQEIHVAVNRMYPGADNEITAFLPTESLTLAQSIHAFTAGSAYANHLELRTGTLEIGKDADLVVVDRNVFTEPADQIASAHAILTIVAGQVVFDSGEL